MSEFDELKEENGTTVEETVNNEPNENININDSNINTEVQTTNTETEEEELSESEKLILEAKKDAKWYVLHTFSGYENVAKENLIIVIDKYNLQTRIFDIVIPMEDVVEEKNGKRKIVTRKLMPGYILVKMNYGDDIWHAVTRTRGITGFAGPKGRPLHLNEEEVRKMHLEKQVVVEVNVTEGDKVEVLDGALSGFLGVVKSVDAASKKCRVVVEMFGRETPVDLPLNQIRKID